MPIRTFVPFNIDEDIVRGNQTTITTGLWSGDVGSLSGSQMQTSTTQITANGSYYFDVYNKSPNDSTAEVQFAVAYGNIDGGGSPTLNQDDLSNIASKAVYLQYKNILLDPSDDLFTFGNTNSRHIYVINIARGRLREQLDPGNWSLALSGSIPSPSGSVAGEWIFIDDSGQTLSAQSSTSKSGRIFNVCWGKLEGVSGSTIYTSQSTDGKGFGLVYPDLGIIVLNPDAIVPTVGFSGSAGSSGASAMGMENMSYSTDVGDLGVPFAPITGSLTTNVVHGKQGPAEQRNHDGLYRAIVKGNDFQARSAETISSTHYFVRLRNKDFNYSNNPTFYNNTNGQILNEDFVQDPHVYATTIGLYNDNKELLAVAKMSRPLEKTFDKEALVRVRLDF